jgi:hypothetical protein
MAIAISVGARKRRLTSQEEALDEALENTFPASDPVSIEQPMTSGPARFRHRLVQQREPLGIEFRRYGPRDTGREAGGYQIAGAERHETGIVPDVQTSGTGLLPNDFGTFQFLKVGSPRPVWQTQCCSMISAP